MLHRIKTAVLALLCFGYLLGISRGHLALWVGDDPQPAYVFSLRADSLPARDQLLLQEGIYLADQSALLDVLHKYL